MLHFSTFHKSVTDGRTDGRTDRRTDGPTDIPSYRDARTHLKIMEIVHVVPEIGNRNENRE